MEIKKHAEVIITMNETEASWLKKITQYPICYPMDDPNWNISLESDKGQVIRKAFWNILDEANIRT